MRLAPTRGRSPSSQVVALALRHAILPKHYGAKYELHEEWGTYGLPQHFYTDGGKDFRSNHLNQIGVQLGFVCHLRDRPSEGGIVERPFKTFNTELFSTLPGYTGSNVQELPEDAEKARGLRSGFPTMQNHVRRSLSDFTRFRKADRSLRRR